jgi:hypothetical protein
MAQTATASGTRHGLIRLAERFEALASEQEEQESGNLRFQVKPYAETIADVGPSRARSVKQGGEDTTK